MIISPVSSPSTVCIVKTSLIRESYTWEVQNAEQTILNQPEEGQTADCSPGWLVGCGNWRHQSRGRGVTGFPKPEYWECPGISHVGTITSSLGAFLGEGLAQRCQCPPRRCRAESLEQKADQAKGFESRLSWSLWPCCHDFPRIDVSSLWKRVMVHGQWTLPEWGSGSRGCDSGPVLSAQYHLWHLVSNHPN